MPRLSQGRLEACRPAAFEPCAPRLGELRLGLVQVGAETVRAVAWPLLPEPSMIPAVYTHEFSKRSSSMRKSVLAGAAAAAALLILPPVAYAAIRRFLAGTH